MELSINYLTAAVAGLLVLAFLFFRSDGSENKKKQVQENSSPSTSNNSAQAEGKSTSVKKKKKKSKKKKKKTKKKKKAESKVQVPTIVQNDDDDNAEDNEDSDEENEAVSSKNRNKAKKKTVKRLEIPGGKKAHVGSVQIVEDPGLGWTTVGKKSKKKNKTNVETTSTAAPVKNKGVSFVSVPQNKVGVIIGAKHATRLLIETKSGCSVEVPSGQNSSVKTLKVKLTGNGSQRQLAQAIINDLAQLGFSPRLVPGLKIYKITVPTSLLPVLRGNKFAALKALEEDGNVKIALPDTSGKTATCKVKVGGKKAGLERTKKNLALLSKYFHCEVTHPGLVHQELYNCEVSYVVGPRGQTIRSIQGDTKTKIYTPKAGSPNQNIVVVGKKADVVRAVSQVAKAVGSDVTTITTKPQYDDFEE